MFNSRPSPLRKYRKTFSRLFLALMLIFGLAASVMAQAPPTPAPATWKQTVNDCVTGDHFIENQNNNQPDPGCDDHQVDLYERPFNNSDQKNFYGDLDLVEVRATDDATWYYFRIELYSTFSGKLDAMYGIEADVDGDGFTDWYWTSTSPTSNIRVAVGYNTWGRKGVKAYYDLNGDVGGATAAAPNAGWSGNGYEQVDSDQESGTGMYAMSPSGVSDKVVIVAVRKSMIAARNGGVVPTTIWWRGWAEKGLQDPSNNHHHDKFTHAQAGDPYVGSPFFPTQNVYQDDNTNGLDDCYVKSQVFFK